MAGLKTTENSKEKIVEVCCTWRKDSDCKNCLNKSVLDCKWKRENLMRFFLITIPVFLFLIAFLVLAGIAIGAWWWFGVIIGYFALFFIIETRILCSHCPYYSENSIILHCLANQGFIKFYDYHPEPMNKLEKALLVIGFILFALVPLGAELYYIIIISLNRGSYSQSLFVSLIMLISATLIAIIFFFTFLVTQICTKCINFSCPFNSVQKKYVDEYLNKNPIMKQAWLECGYKMN
ncbi:MAG: hypothetical protein U9O98_00015 [Asgard group archaeon]|nr:hypothetical protein [Asgard group archaeon]